MGAIESGRIGAVGCKQDGSTIELPTFRFSYKAGDSYYAGSFALDPQVENPQESVLLSVVVYYNSSGLSKVL